MANIKSQKKRILTNEKSRQYNVAITSRMKTQIKKAEDAIAAKDSAQIAETLTSAISEIDKAACKGVLHQKSAARKKSSLQRQATAAQSS